MIRGANYPNPQIENTFIAFMPFRVQILRVLINVFSIWSLGKYFFAKRSGGLTCRNQNKNF